MQRIVFQLSFTLLLCFASPAFAQEATEPISQSDLVFAEVDGIVAVEAEHFILQEKADIRAWYRVEENQAPNVKPDPDGPHLLGASGGCYLEALPDSRATHDDPIKIGESFFPYPGRAGVLTYRIYFTNPGRYYVWVRHYSTGSEDNGLHVGLDEKWPESGRRWQTIKKRKWAWESRQRTDEVHIGVRLKLYLDVDTAGEHQVHFSIREDGFEFDKFVLASSRDFIPEGFGPAPVVKSGAAPTVMKLSASYADATISPEVPETKSPVSKGSDAIRPPEGRLAIVADGNSPDPDDIGAIAVIFGLLKASGQTDRLVYLSHSCDLKPTVRIPVEDELRRQQVLDQICRDGVAQFGPFKNLAGYFNCRTAQQAAVDDLRAAINESSQTDPLWIIEAGEPDMIGFALKDADAKRRKHVHVVSHHTANDDAGDFFSWQQILDFNVAEHQIGDQNVGLKTAIDPWDWAKNHRDENIQWIWKQLAYAEQDGVVEFQTNHFDCSDAGMVYWWITGADQDGNNHATPAEIKKMLLHDKR